MIDKRNLASLPARLLDRIGLALPSRFPVHFIIERGNWSIKWDGTYIAQGVEALRPSTICVDDKPFLLAQRIVHFGSQFQWEAWHPFMPSSNRMICTFFHGKREDDVSMMRHVDNFLASLPKLEKVITAASLIEERLLSWGVPRGKLVRIPIGVDTKLFRPASPEQRASMRAKFGIKPEQFVLASYQKDGVGWGDGMEPKLIKGPDVLVDVAKKLAKEIPVFVMLTGPARGYVKKALSDAGIPFAHEFLSNYLDLPSHFHIADAYINPSREEGGPKGIIESMAAGVPLVSTKVGMASDVITHGENAMLHEVGDVDGLVQSLLKIAHREELRATLIKNGLESVKTYDWANVAKQHYDKVYLPMLEGRP